MYGVRTTVPGKLVTSGEAGGGRDEEALGLRAGSSEVLAAGAAGGRGGSDGYCGT